MNIYSILILLCVKIICSAAAPTNVDKISVYEKILLSIEDQNLKCPYLRKTKFITPEPRFLNLCGDYNAIKDITELNYLTYSPALCMLYYVSFKQLCAASNNISESEFHASYSDNSLMSDMWVNSTCEFLKTLPLNSESPIVSDIVQNHTLCVTICRGSESSLDVCKWSALMLNATSSFIKPAPPFKPKQTESEDHQSKQQPPNNKPISVISVNQPDNTQGIEPQIDKSKPDELPSGNNLYHKSPSFTSQLRKPAIDKSPEIAKNEETAEPLKSAPGQSITVKEPAGKLAAGLPINQLITGKNPAADLHSNVKQNQQISQPADAEDTSHEVYEPISEGKLKLVDSTSETANIAGATKVASDETKTAAPEMNRPVDTETEAQKLPSFPENASKDQNAPTDDNMDLDEPTLHNAGDESIDEDGDDDAISSPAEMVKHKEEITKPLHLSETENDINYSHNFQNQSITEDNSYFFPYFMMVCIFFILGYVGYHNKQKIFALVLEGRKGKRQQRRRPNSANYHKLDSNLEEAVTSACIKNTANVIY